MRAVPKRWLAGLGALALSATVAGAPAPFVPTASAVPSIDLTFFNINDFHGRIDSNLLKFAGTVEQQRQLAGPETDSVLLSAGDNIGASVYNSSAAKDQPTIDVLNALGLKASAVGNHEFDKGYDDLKNRVIAGSEGNNKANWDYLGANVYAKGTTTPVLPEYSLFTMGAGGEVTVAVIGVVTEETYTLVSPGGISTLDFGDPVDAVNRVAAKLTDGDTANGEAEIIVAEYHEGAPDNAADGTIDQEVAKGGTFAKIVTQTSAAVDVIFTGHTHKNYAYDYAIPGDPEGDKRPIVQTGSYGDNLGKVVLTLNPDNGDVFAHTQANVQRLAVTPAANPSSPTPAETTAFDNFLVTTYPRVAAVKAIYDPAVVKANQVGSVPVGSVTADITTAYSGGAYTNGLYAGGTRDDRSKESSLGDLVADALVDRLSAPEYGGAEIGVVNPGGLRSDLKYAQASGEGNGIVTVKEANEVLPFANSLFTVTLTGAQFKTLLEQQWQRLPNNTVPTSRPYLQLGLSDNVTYTFDSTLAEGSRITSVTVNGKALNPTANYRIGTFSFLTDGGDNFHIFKQGTNKKDSGLIDADAWYAFLGDNAGLSPDFARQAVEVSPIPTSAPVGSTLAFTVKGLDLTSLGSPANTSLAVSVGGVKIADVPVASGTANVNVVVPATTGGRQNIVLTASPSGTVVFSRSLNPIEPNRVFDTRADQSPQALRVVPKEKIGGTTELKVKLTDLPGLVPASGVGAVSLNVAVTNPELPGFITVYPCGTRELVASINYTAGQTVSNLVTAPVSANGEVCFFSNAKTDLVVDVSGWLPESSGFGPLPPTRVFDTRAGESPAALRTVDKKQVGPDSFLEVKLTDLPGLVPAVGVSAVSLNVAVTNSALDGFVTAYPCGERKLVASVNYLAGQTVSNAVIAPVSPTGTVCFYSQRAADIVVDINGYFEAGSGYTAVAPERIADTRVGESPAALVSVPKVKIGGDPALQVKVVDLAGLVPATGVGAVSLNVAVTNPEGNGFITVFPCGELKLVANVNFVLGQTVSNAVSAPVSAAGTVCFYSNVKTDLVIDINGWYAG